MNKAKLILILTASIISLTGCVPAVFVAGAAAGTAAGAVIYNNRTMQAMVDDRDITSKAEALLDADPNLKFASHITLTTFNRIVLVVGQTPSSEYRDRAIRLIQSVSKVKRIYNELVIAKPTPAKVRSQDIWITTKVKTSLLAEKGLHSTQVKVLTEDGAVYLMGLVSRSQGELAAQVVSKVEGVKKVVKLFEYIH